MTNRKTQKTQNAPTPKVTSPPLAGTNHFFDDDATTYDASTQQRQKQPKAFNGNPADDTMLCKRVVTKDRRYITQITCYEKGSEGAGDKDKKALRLPVYAKQTNGGTLASLFNFARQGTSPLLLLQSHSDHSKQRDGIYRAGIQQDF